MGMDHATRKINTADTEIPPLPFEEAVSFMKGRVPMTKTEWNELEPKLRFRAFTVARLAQCDFIETVRGRLINAMEKGEGFASTWSDIKAVAEADGVFQFRSGYWENVFRTNTQTAYTAGKLMQYRNNPPPAWNLLIVDDSRTSDICRGLIHIGKQSLAMPSNHPFWEKFGFPPYHFQCRTGLQAVYSSQIGTDIQVENPTMKSLGKHFKPMEGFGGNPLEKDWWDLTDSMRKRAEKYGIAEEFKQTKENLVSDPIKNKMQQSLENEKDIRELGQMVIDKANEENTDIIEVLKEYREFGTDQKHTWMKGSNSYAKEEVIKALQNYPREWLEKSIEASIENPLLLKYNMKRGSYSELLDPTLTVGPKATSATHELGHRMESLMQEIVQREKEFFERRVAQFGNKKEFLSAMTNDQRYGSETAMYGNFIHPYMGKINKSGKFELLPMGIENIFSGNYNINGDKDFYSFIIGLLLGV